MATSDPSAVTGRTSDRSWLGAAAAIFVVAALLAPSLRAGFVWDDLQQIEHSPTLGSDAPLTRYFGLNLVQSTGSAGRSADGVDVYRPGVFLVLEAIHAVAGRRPAAYHATILAAHLLVCIFLWAVARRWLPDPRSAWLVILLFGFHPVTSEAYLFATAISEPLAAAGLLGAILLLDPGRTGNQPGWARSTGAAVVLLAGLLSKEVVLAATPAIGWYLWRVRGVRPIRMLPTLVASIAFLGARDLALGGLQATGLDNGHRLRALAAYPILVLDGLCALITQRPVGVRHLYWEYRDLAWGWSVAAGVVVVVAAVVAWRVRASLPIATTAVAIGLLMLAPVALVVTVPGWGGFGRYLYVPWAFLTVAAIAVGGAARHRLRPRLRVLPAVVAAVFVVTAAVGSRTALANWSSQEALATAAIEVFPAGPDAWEWLGNVHLERGELGAAARCYETAVDLAPDLQRPRHNLAAAWLYLGRPAAALAQLDELDRRFDANPVSSRLRVEALEGLGRIDEARDVAMRSMTAWPDDPALQQLARRLQR